jgi:hypothetical protein
MRGHENLIALRKSGLKPSGLVHVCDYPVQPKFLRWDHTEDGQHPTVCVHGDDIASLDLRFIVGLPVDVTGTDAKRVKALASLCKKSGADMVIANDGKRFAVWTKEGASWLSF